MKLVKFLTLLLILTSMAKAQIGGGPASKLKQGTALPATCSKAQIFFLNTTNVTYTCTTEPSTWTALAGGGGTIPSTANVLIGDGSGNASSGGVSIATTLNDSARTCTDAGANDTYACNLSPAVAAYVTKGHYAFIANTANTGAATINFNSVGAKSIVKFAGGASAALIDNDIRVGQLVELVYDGTNMQMTSATGNATSGATAFAGLSDSSTSTNGGGTISTHVGGSVRNAIGGAYTTDATTYTITHSSGTENCTIRSYWDMSVTPPIKVFMIDSGCTPANYTLSNGAWVVGSAFPAGTSAPLATIPVVAGVIGTPTLFRTGDTASAPPCGTGLVANGINCDVTGISRGIGIAFDGGGSALTAKTGYVTVPFACSIVAWNINVDAGTATFKLWRKATGTAIPTIADTLNTSGTAISSGTSVHSTTLSDFSSVAIVKNDILGFNLSAVATATFASITYECVQ